MTAITIRKATRSDCKTLATLATQLNEHHDVFLEVREDKLERDFDRINVYVAHNDAGDLLGFLQGYETYFLHQAMQGYEIQNLYVAKAARKTGVGRAIMQYVITEKVKDGAEIFRLTLLKNNSDAFLFYQSLGFEFKDGNIVYFGKLADHSIHAFLRNIPPST